jgi:glycosyltransferase involved in cell wall biosynthesis
MSSNPKTFKYNITAGISNFTIDIVIPFRDQANKVCRLIENLYQKVTKPKIRLHLIDDGSKNKEFVNLLPKLPNLITHQFSKPKGFGAAVNYGIKCAQSPLVCIMHSDVIVTEPNFLQNLYNDFLKIKDQRVATISSVTDNPMSEKLFMIKKNGSEDVPPQYFTDVYSPFICTLVHKQIYELCGGLAEYPLCWYEGEIFGSKIKKINYRQAYSLRSFVQHEGGATIRHLLTENPSMKKILKDNYEKFKLFNTTGG